MYSSVITPALSKVAVKNSIRLINTDQVVFLRKGPALFASNHSFQPQRYLSRHDMSDMRWEVVKKLTQLAEGVAKTVRATLVEYERDCKKGVNIVFV